LNNFAKRYVKSKFPLKSDKNNEYFAWRPIYIYNYILLSFS
jgi:hypothetical protein